MLMFIYIFQAPPHFQFTKKKKKKRKSENVYLVVCGCLLVVSGCLLVVSCGFWSFADGL